ncbi:MAG: hypothetical protein ACI4KR_04840 [Ruminiclostridium sp.]
MFTTEEIMNLIATGRTDLFYKDRYWRNHIAPEIMQEQRNECYFCKQRGRYTAAKLVHHIKELRKFPQLAYSRYWYDEHGAKHLNLVAVCQQCHEEQHGRAFSPYSRRKFVNEEKW